MEIDSAENRIIKEKILDKLSKESLMVVSTAYLYAKNYVNYGYDITKAWSTAVEQTSILERVKIDAQAEAYDSFKKDYEKQLKADLVAILTEIQTEIEETAANITYQENKDRKGTWGLRKASEIIDKYKEKEIEE